MNRPNCNYINNNYIKNLYDCLQYKNVMNHTASRPKLRWDWLQLPHDLHSSKDDIFIFLVHKTGIKCVNLYVK